jgi:flagellar basal-body rod protein FlgF
MDNTSYIALSRVNALTHDLEVTSNNLANANTTGFKASRELFSDYIVRQKDIHGTPGARTEAYTQDRATYQNHGQGQLRQTGNPTDFAINGEGFFCRADHAGRAADAQRPVPAPLRWHHCGY